MKKQIARRVGFISGLLFLCPILIFSACRKNPDSRPSKPQLHYIREVCILYRGETAQGELRLEDPEQMQPILNYLRLSRPLGIPSEDPEAISGEEIEILLNYADGTQKQYRQRCGRYLKEDSHPWQEIAPNRAAMLTEILKGLKLNSLGS